MRFFSALPLAFCAIGAFALPTAQPVKVARAETLLEAVEAELDTLSVNLNDTIDQLVDALGLEPVVDDVDALLKGLVGDVDEFVDEIDSAVDGLLDDLGLGLLVTTIDDLEVALGLSPTDTIGTLLKDLGILT